MNYDNTSQTNHNAGNNNIREGDANKATKKTLQNKSHVKIILSDPTETNITNNSKSKTNPIIIATLIIIVIIFDLLKHNNLLILKHQNKYCQVLLYTHNLYLKAVEPFQSFQE